MSAFFIVIFYFRNNRRSMNAFITQAGLICTTLAYITWGLTPLFYQFLHQDIQATEIFSLRVIWSLPVLALVFILSRHRCQIWSLLKDKRSFFWLLLSTLCVSVSWYLNTWGVTHGQVLMVSLAFFLTPLISILVGVLFLGERLNRLQLLAIAFCLSGFAWACLSLEQFPWLTIGIALSFGGYSLIKKQVAIDALNGLTIEALLMLPVAAGYLFLLGDQGQFVQADFNECLLLVMIAPVVLLPLALFSFGVPRLQSLTVVAVLQYIEPTLYFLIGAFVFGETIDLERTITFSLIWIGFLIFCLNSLFGQKHPAKQVPHPTP